MNPLFKQFFPPTVVTFISDSTMDYTLKMDNPRQELPLTLEQKERLFQQTDIPIQKLVNLVQVHQDRILSISSPQQYTQASLQEADGWITNLKNVPLVVRTADCLPVFLFDEAGCIGLIHAGWRGTKLKIVTQAVDMMVRQFHADLARIQVGFGPAIHQCCYEVGEEFVQHFPQETVKFNGRYHLDLVAANRNQLLQLGLKQTQIFDVDICTCCDHNYFSYRREGSKAGRMISLMMLKN